MKFISSISITHNDLLEGGLPTFKSFLYNFISSFEDIEWASFEVRKIIARKKIKLTQESLSEYLEKNNKSLHSLVTIKDEEKDIYIYKLINSEDQQDLINQIEE